MRGTSQGDSHGGVYIIDLENREVRQEVDWNTTDIEWQGRGWDRGLRGIAFDGDRVFIAASDELFAYDSDFNVLGSWKSKYLRHCHEICTHERKLFLSSTAFDSVLVFDLDENEFVWGLHIDMQAFRFRGVAFDPRTDDGPIQLNKMHLNSVIANDNGLYVSGTTSGGMLHFNGEKVYMSATLPAGNHNAQPWRNGVLYIDTESDSLRYGCPDGSEDRRIRLPRYEPSELQNTDLDESGIARQGFGRGLCVLSDSVVATGSSPSTVSIHDVRDSKTVLSVNLTMDVRNAIHGLEVWPFE